MDHPACKDNANRFPHLAETRFPQPPRDDLPGFRQIGAPI
jgi:hypothetical protein